MRRVFIIRKDLHLSPGKIAAMVGHAAELYWLNQMKKCYIDNEYEELLAEDPWKPRHPAIYRDSSLCAEAKKAFKQGKKKFKHRRIYARKTISSTLELPKSIWEGYVNGIYTKTICESRNLSHLLKAKAIADELGLKENEDYGFINDKCLTELKPENEDGTTTVGMWFAPLADEVAHKISRKFPLLRDQEKNTGLFGPSVDHALTKRIRKFNEVCEMSKGGLQTFKAPPNPPSSAAPEMARKVSRGFKCVKCGERYRAKDVVTFDTPTGTPPRRFICRECAEEEGIDFEEAKDKEGE